jgi:hypothetical protein
VKSLSLALSFYYTRINCLKTYLRILREDLL